MTIVAIDSEDRIQLESLARSTKDAKTAIRIRVVLALDAGYRVKEVAALFLLDEDTVAKWRNRYLRRRLFTDWLATTHQGSVGKLTWEQERALDAYITQETITDAAHLATYVQQTYGVTYTVNGIPKLLHRLGFVYKHTTLIPGKLDAVKQAAFKKTYEKLRDTLPADEAILFTDGVHPSHNVHATKAWIKKGQEKQVPTNTGRKRLNSNGALNLETMETVTHFSETINAEETIKLYNKIEAAYPDKRRLYVIQDNARYYRNKLVAAYLRKRKCRIKVLFLPAYSPNLNFIERLWHFLKHNIIGSKRRETFKEFAADIHAFFDHIGDYQERLRQFIGTEMHLLKVQA